MWSSKNSLLVLTMMVAFVAGCVPPTVTVTPVTVTPPVSVPPSATPMVSPLLPQVPTGTPTPMAAAWDGGLLVNGGMEVPYGCPESATCLPNGWNYFIEHPASCRPLRMVENQAIRCNYGEAGCCDIPCPDNGAVDSCVKENGQCVADTGCYWMRSEFTEVKRSAYPNRVHGGNSAATWFGFGRMFDGGFYQRVSGVQVGSVLEFSAWVQAWICYKFQYCQGGAISYLVDMSDIHPTARIRVGIDPTGGVDYTSPDVVWSQQVDSLDEFSQLSVRATAQAENVTVFVRGSPAWGIIHENNNYYVDDARLAVVAPPVTYTNWIYLPAVFSGGAQAPLPISPTPIPAPLYYYVLIHPNRVSAEWEAALAATAWTLTTDEDVLESNLNFVVVVHPEEFGLLVESIEGMRVTGHAADSQAVMADTPVELLLILRGG